MTRNLIDNGSFSAPVTPSLPPGFRTGNTYSYDRKDPGLYSIIISRKHGLCHSTPQFDKTQNDSTGQYLWYDTSEKPDIPDTAWRPYFSDRKNGDSSCVFVKPNTVYTFSFWVRDIARELCIESDEAPIVGVNINGARLKTLDIGRYFSPCCPDWINICVDWNSGTQSKAFPVIQSLRKTGHTDLGIDDIFFGEKTPVIQHTGDSLLNCGEMKQIETNLAPGTFYWNTGEEGNTLKVSQPGSYWIIQPPGKCSVKSDTISFIRTIDGRIQIPNVFTPNNDHINDLFRPVMECPVSDYELRIYDRWGIQLFLSNDQDKGWDGTFNRRPVPDGTYYYIMRYTLLKQEKLEGVVLKIQ